MAGAGAPPPVRHHALPDGFADAINALADHVDVNTPGRCGLHRFLRDKLAIVSRLRLLARFPSG